ncbi:MAG: methylated-DNA--[protein]-cysteine S-methyltransferase [Phaeodactylibacter sp.]|nr:methylated-DNA--[protein]-cysteine S-methyltransferase [Phaeodactylibacter sp.]MCB9272610.1 methylated-DNA--[protein]-cysteine S-methyltransferase [Lewinellaceae bacterium]
MLEKTYFFSPFGCIEIKGSSLGVSSVKFIDKKPCPVGPIPEVLRDCVIQLDEYFKGQRTEFSLKLDFGGAPAFHQAVWQELLNVPFGRTTTYIAIAEKLGDTKAVRAVGQANAHNPIAIIVPCHRCIAKSGDLQGYFYGLDMKRQLLELENPMSFARQGSLF